MVEEFQRRRLKCEKLTDDGQQVINDFIFDIWLLHGELYRVSPYQVYCTSTSCLPHDLEFLAHLAKGNQVIMPKSCIKNKIISSSSS
jgi:hypothetical protein